MNDIDFETFIKKECKDGKEGWLVTELRNFCNILGLKHTGSKSELCERLNDYFKRKDSTSTKNRLDEKLKEEEKRNNYKDELKQKDLLEKVYKEQQRIREEELKM